MHLRLALIFAVLVGSAFLFPAAFFGILIGLDGLRSAFASHQGAASLLPNLAFLLLGLGAVAGPVGVLAALLAPKPLFRAHSLLRSLVSVALVWGILAAACAGGVLMLGALFAGAARSAGNGFFGLLAIGLAVGGALVLRVHRREA